MKHLFIDTNIFLSFYAFSNDDLEELRKLDPLIGDGKIRLLVTQQVLDEFSRNRENKISEAIKKVKEQKLKLQFPQICMGYPEYKEIQKGLKITDKAHSKLINKIEEDIMLENLQADKVINKLFSAATVLKVDADIITKAKLRMAIGNPPGKTGSLGDAINWSALIKLTPEKTALHFISADRDYSSPLDNEKMNNFLKQEWTARKKAPIYYYRSLSGFFKEHYPDIKLAAELEKDVLIKELSASSSFQNTHSVVSRFGRYSDFTADQVNAIVDAVISNSQIRLIASDADVLEFIERVVEGREGDIGHDKICELEEVMQCEAQDEEEDQ